MVTDLPLERIAAEIGLDELGKDRADPIFGDQDSGCVSYGVEARGHRWFVKTAKSDAGARSLRNGIEFHAAVSHPAIVAPVRVFEAPTPTLVYPWAPGQVLNQANTAGSDRSALDRFRLLPVDHVRQAITTVLDAHRHIAGHGFIAVDFYDGALFYDFETLTMWLIDLDDYRPGPFTLDRDRLPGSLRYMAPEEFRRGTVIDQRTNVYTLGRMIHHLLDTEQGWRGSPEQTSLVARATAGSPDDRFQTIDRLAAAWLDSLGSDDGPKA